MKCYNAAMELILEAQNAKGNFVGDLDRLRACCDLTETLANKCDAEAVDVFTDDSNNVLVLKVACMDIVMQDKDDTLFSLSELVDSVIFYQNNPDEMVAEFILVDVWEK